MAMAHIPRCSWCKLAIVATTNRFRLWVTNSTLNALGKTVTEVAKTVGIMLQISESNNYLCRRCRDIVLHVSKAEHQLSTLRDQLKGKFVPSTLFESVTQSTMVNAENRPHVHKPASKRTLTSPAAKTGVSPAAKKSTLRPVPCARRSLMPLLGRESTAVTHPQPTAQTQPSNIPLTSDTVLPYQKVLTVPTYEDIEVDPKEDVKVVSTHNPSKVRFLPSSLRSIGLALLNRTCLITALMNDKNLKDKLVKAVVDQIKRECIHLCEKKNFCSILRKVKQDELLRFSWDDVLIEWTEEAPIFLQILSAAAKPTASTKLMPEHIPAVCVAGAVLLKNRNMHMSAIQHIIGLLLFHGNVNKQTRIRLNHLQLTVSPTATLTKMTEFGNNFDEKVLSWIQVITEKLESNGLRFEDGGFTITIQLLGDNVDVREHASRQTMEKRDKDHHWFHIIAVRDRVVNDKLSIAEPTTDITKLPLHTFLPSVSDCEKLHTEFVILVGRVIVKNLTAFKPLSTLVPEHIPHKYSSLMAQKSEIVPLGVLTKSEIFGEDMVDIMYHMQRYIPKSSDGKKFFPLLFGGDQLTRERAYHAQDSKLQSSDPLHRLLGLVPKVEDWHTRSVFYQVMFNKMYNKASIGDKGTLRQLQVIINRQNLPSQVKDDTRAVEEFLEVVLDAHIIAQYFGMDTTESVPTRNIDLENILGLPLEQQKSAFYEVIAHIVNEYALRHTHTAVPSCETTIPCSVTEEPFVLMNMKKGEDHVHNYATCVLGMGLLARNFHDSSREGDGERSLRCWKFFLLHFKADGRTKYSIEALNLLAQVNGLLSEQMTHQLMWNRTCNPRGGSGNNIPLDLHLEHLNRVFKDNINSFKSNVSEQSVSRSSQAIGPIKELIERFDRITHIKTPSGKHTEPSVNKDLYTLLQVLKQEEVFQHTPGRSHHCFHDFNADPFEKIKPDPNKLHKWIRSTIKSLAIDKSIRTTQRLM